MSTFVSTLMKRSKNKYIFPAAMAALGASFATPYVLLDLWHDEVYTLQHFVLPGFAKAFTDYHLPNNHIVFSALMIPWFGLLELLNGPTWCLRLLPMAFAVGSVVFLYFAVDLAWGRRAALAASIPWATSHLYAGFACQLRGYSLSCFLLTLGMLLVVKWLDRPRPLFLLGYMLTSVIAVGVLPTNLFVFLSLGLWPSLITGQDMLRNYNRRALYHLTGWLSGPAIGLGWYLWHPVVRRQFFGHVPGGKAGFDHVLYVLGSIGKPVLWETWWLILLVIAGLFLGVVKRSAGDYADHRGEENRISAIGLFLAALLPLFSAWRLPLFPRNLLPVIPLWFALLGVAYEVVLKMLEQARPVVRDYYAVPLVILILAACYREARIKETSLAMLIRENFNQLYYHYYQSGFKPAMVIDFLVQEESRRRMAAFTDETDMVALSFYAQAARFKSLFRYNTKTSPLVYAECVRNGWAVLAIGKDTAGAERIVKTISGSNRLRGRLVLLKDTGLFKVYEYTR